eukprot:775200-Pyramimonas_sp.AAC.1
MGPADAAPEVAQPPAKPEGSETAKGPPKPWSPSLRDPEPPPRANRWNFDRASHADQRPQKAEAAPKAAP